MKRARLASIFAILWSAVQAWTLLLVGFYPWDRPIGWMLCVVAFVISAGLWVEKSWARISSLVLGGVLMTFYVVTQAINPNSCFRDPSTCSLLLVFLQPTLVLVLLAFVFKPFASSARTNSDKMRESHPIVWKPNKKLFPPPLAVGVVVLVLLAYAALNVWHGYKYASVWFALWVVPTLIAAAGLVFVWSWSRYVLYALNTLTFLGWSAVFVVASFHHATSDFLSLGVLGIAIIAFGIWSSKVARLYLVPQTQATRP